MFSEYHTLGLAPGPLREFDITGELTFLEEQRLRRINSTMVQPSHRIRPSQEFHLSQGITLSGNPTSQAIQRSQAIQLLE